MFFEDNPISFSDDDLLGRRDFVESLAQAILNIDNGKCLTISLMGKWGSGKSSIINMVKDYWDKDESDNIVIDFNPWYFSNQDNLFFQFFNELSNVSEKDFTDKINKDNLKRLGKSLINMTSVNLKLGIVDIDVDPEVSTEVDNQESLLNLKKEISNEFEKLDKNVIIIMDDIDRLSDNEIKQILMLVKSLADFPNVIYILLFDKDAVVGSLNNLKVHAPNEFIEKIIQIPIVVPEIRKSQLDNLILIHLGEFYEKYHDEVDFEKDLLDIYSYLRLFFDNLRDLYCYLNIINFYFSVIKDDVNINDFMLILALQLFEHKIYNEIKINRDLFLVLGKNQKFSENSGCRDKISKIINLHSKLSKMDVRKILLKLFPKIKNYCKSNSIVTVEELKISNENYFENYFALNLDSGDIEIYSVDLFKLNDSNRISEIFLEYNKNNRTKELFDLIINRMDDIFLNNAQYFIDSLIDIGDLLKISDAPFLHKNIYVSRILEDLLKKYKNNSERFSVLENAINNSENSLYVAIDFLSDQDFIYNRFDYANDKNDVSKALLNEEDLDKLEEIMVLKIRQWDENGRLWFSPDLEGILYSWGYWDRETDVVKRVEEFNLEGKNSLIFAKGFRNVTSTLMHSGSIPEISQKFNLNSMLMYFEDIDELRNNYIKVCVNESLNDEEKEIYQSLLMQIEEKYGNAIYKSGQKSCIGKYFCIKCRQVIIIDNPKISLPPCPNCGNKEFFKEYSF